MQSKTKYLALSALCTALMIVGAYLRFPLPILAVQFTTQVFFLLVTGLMLPPKYSTGALCAYMLLGLMGLPVFSQGGGLQTVFTFNFGYLLGFIFSAFLTSILHQRWKKKKWGYILPALIGMLAVYAIALPYAALLAALYMAKPISFTVLMNGFFLTFLPLDIIKAAGAALVAKQVQKALQ